MLVCLKLVVSARARARDLQVDFQVEKANKAIVAKSVVTKPALPVSKDKSPKMRSHCFADEGCRNGDECKFRHGRVNGKCPRCGSVHHNLAHCDRPSRLKNAKQGKGKSMPARPTSKTPARGRTADAQAQRSPDKAKDKKKGKGKGKSEKSHHKVKAKTGEADFADEDQEEVDDNVDVNEEDAEGCEAVAEFLTVKTSGSQGTLRVITRVAFEHLLHVKQHLCPRSL